MNTLEFLIIEDETINIEILQLMLKELGHNILAIANNYDEAIQILDQKKPDLALVDIILGDAKDGILLGQMLHDKYNVPFIFTTSLADNDTIQKVKRTQPNGYLVKPFKQDDLYAAIELAMFNSNFKNTPKSLKQEDFFIKDEHKLIKLLFNDLLFIKSEGNYIQINTVQKKYLIKSSLKDFLKKLPQDIFFQVHKSYIVNLNYINALSGNTMVINGQSIPITRTYKDGLLTRLNIL